MEYISRVFNYYRPEPSKLPSSTAPNAPQAPAHSLASQHSNIKAYYPNGRHSMTPFNGPWSKDISAFRQSVDSIPDRYKKSFTDASRCVLEKICDPNALHVWESDSDMDNLLQLTCVIAKLCNLGLRAEQSSNAKTSSMVIIAEERKGRDNFARLCQLVAYLTRAKGKRQLEDTVCVYGKIVVVEGWNNSLFPAGMGNKEAAEKVVRRINVAIDRMLTMGDDASGSKRKIVWHHGAVISFLLHWINNTTRALRTVLEAVTITGSLHSSHSITPSARGRANTLSDLARLEGYAKRLDIAVVFLDTSSQLISDYLATYMFYHAYYINTLLPLSLSRPHLGKAQDELVTFAFRLRAASEGRYGGQVVKMVKAHLDASKAKPWARACIEKTTYEPNQCRAAGKEATIHRAVRLADSPFALLSHGNGIPAFARLAAGPAAEGKTSVFIAAPAQIDFKQARLRPRHPTVFFLLLPAKDQDAEKVSRSIQGLMLGVLERVFREKGKPHIGQVERESWKTVVGGCMWAMEGCGGKMPKGMMEKVEHVKDRLKNGTWAYALTREEEGGGGRESTRFSHAGVTGMQPPQHAQTHGLPMGLHPAWLKEPVS